MGDWLVGIAVGFASGVLSGAFGIGGGIITTPAIRMLTDAAAIVAVATPLPVIIPTAVTGAMQYHRQGIADLRSGVWIGVAGAATAVGGALLATRVGGKPVLIGTALLIFWAAGDTLLQIFRGEKRPPEAPQSERPHRTRLAVIGAVAGLYSGFFGLGGGFVLVPLMTHWLRFPIKRAVGTSLVAVALLAVPGTVTHAILGNIDWRIAAALTLGVIPGAALGARVTLGAADRTVRIGFATLLVVVGIWLAASELTGVRL